MTHALLLKSLRPQAVYSLLTGLLLLILSHATLANSLSASVDRDTISLEETLTLTLRYDAQTNATPEFASLQKDFDILNTQRSNQMRVINGDMESFTDWRIALAPKRTGTLQIPAFTIDGANSNPITITVEAQSRAPQNASSDVFVDVEINKDSVYVQEQLLLTIRLYTAVNLNGAEMQPLELPDALVVDLGEKQFQTSINGRPHIVVERVYSVFPQHSGELIIPSLTYNVSASSGQRDPWNNLYGNSNSNLLRLRTEEQKITVNTIPPQFNGQAWMPAAQVELTEHWSGDTERLKVGEPVTRTITVKAEGLTAGQIVPLSAPSIEGLTFYPDQAQNDDQTTSKGVTGSRIETQALIPNRSGKFTLPAVTINWWDTTNQKMQTASLPPRTVLVEDTLASLARSESSQQEQQQDDQQTEPSSPTPLNTEISSAASPQALIQPPLWLMALAAVSTLLALVFAGLYWRARQELNSIHSFSNAETTRETIAEKTAWTDLKRASANKDYPAMRTALLHWAQAHWQDPHLHSLNAVADRADSRELREQIKHLDAALYRNEQASWDSGLLVAEVNNTRKKKRDQQTTTGGLAPLYKQ